MLNHITILASNMMAWITKYGFAQNVVPLVQFRTRKIKHATKKVVSTSHTREKVSMTSGGLSKFFNVQNQKFYVITCSKCSYSEFYRADVKAWENIIDFFGN